jgi:dipeptidyl aminopeptidase/acylaminoacyl peptidase
VVAWYPVTELTTLDPDRTDTPEALLLGGAPAALPDLAEQASPMAQVSAAAPPFLLVHGLDDTAVPFAHSERLHQRLTEAGVSSTCLPVAGADHCFAGYTDIPGLIRESVAFLSRELGR